MGHPDPGLSIRMTPARELLGRGRKAAAGLGDVKVAPIEALLGRRFSIELAPPDDCARLESSVAPIKTSVARTHEVVPTGSEIELLDIGRFLEKY